MNHDKYLSSRSVEKELEEDRRTQADLDERAFRWQVRLAGLTGPDAETSLVARFRFHLAIQPLHQQIMQAQGEAQGALMHAGSHRQLSPEAPANSGAAEYSC